MKFRTFGVAAATALALLVTAPRLALTRTNLIRTFPVADRTGRCLAMYSTA